MEKLCVLIVDDTPANIDVLVGMLSPHYRCKIATSGQKALTAVYENEPPDLILLDIMMPEMDGFEVCAKLKENPAANDIPIIFISAMDQAEDQIKGLKLGADDYITKPFFPEIVKARVHVQLQNKKYRDELKSMVSKLENAKKKVEEESSAKEAFFAAMSHELRTPLNGILGIVDVMKYTELTGQQKNHLCMIHESSSSLLMIINDILDYSKLINGKYSFNMESVSIPDIAGYVLKLLTPLAEKKGLMLNLETDESLAESYYIDPDRLRQVFYNLLGNAIKFTEKGRVDIRLILKERKDGKDRVHIVVKDTGIGIPEDKIKSIFNPYEQGGTDINSKYGGTGLGLAICKNIAEAAQGELSVQSRVGEGSSFLLDVTLDISKEKSVSAAEIFGENTEYHAEDIRPEISHLHRILVAEDHPVNQEVFGQQLSMLGFSYVDIAEDGEQAYDMFLNNDYSLVITDNMMPKAGGYDLFTKIRGCREKDGTKIPVIMSTASSSEKDREKIIRYGFTDFLEKPLNIIHLSRIMNTYLAVGTQTDCNHKIIEKTEPRRYKIKEDIYKTMKKIFQTDDMMNNMAKSLHKEQEKDNADIENAYSKGDCLLIGKIGHKVKGAAQTVHAHRLTDVSLHLETAGYERDIDTIESVLPEYWSAVEEFLEVLEEIYDKNQ